MDRTNNTINVDPDDPCMHGARDHWDVLNQELQEGYEFSFSEPGRALNQCYGGARANHEAICRSIKERVHENDDGGFERYSIAKAIEDAVMYYDDNQVINLFGNCACHGVGIYGNRCEACGEACVLFCPEDHDREEAVIRREDGGERLAKLVFNPVFTYRMYHDTNYSLHPFPFSSLPKPPRLPMHRQHVYKPWTMLDMMKSEYIMEEDPTDDAVENFWIGADPPKNPSSIYNLRRIDKLDSVYEEEHVSLIRRSACRSVLDYKLYMTLIKEEQALQESYNSPRPHNIPVMHFQD